MSQSLKNLKINKNIELNEYNKKIITLEIFEIKKNHKIFM